MSRDDDDDEGTWRQLRDAKGIAGLAKKHTSSGSGMRPSLDAINFTTAGAAGIKTDSIPKANAWKDAKQMLVRHLAAI